MKLIHSEYSNNPKKKSMQERVFLLFSFKLCQKDFTLKFYLMFYTNINLKVFFKLKLKLQIRRSEYQSLPNQVRIVAYDSCDI